MSPPCPKSSNTWCSSRLSILLILRSFIVEPSESVRLHDANLLDGDFILVNKYEYGIRLPVLDTKVIDVGVPERGDVVVFRCR